MTPAPQGADTRSVWFPDTSALVTLAAHSPLQKVVQSVLSAHRRVLLKAVVGELQELAKSSDPAGGWATTAMSQLDWLGEPIAVDEPEGLELAAEIQERIAAGRPLKHPLEHYGEAAIISLASRARKLSPLVLSDDYDARVAAKNCGVASASVHKLLHLMVRQGKIAAAQAFSYADALHKAGRAWDYTQDELASGRLGRVGQP